MIQTLLSLMGGLLFGAVAAWLIASFRAKAQHGQAHAVAEELRRQLAERDREETQLRDQLTGEHADRVKAQTELAEAAKSLQQQKQLLAEAERKLSDAFGKLAADALRASNEGFLQLAKESMGGQIKPLAEALAKYETHVKALEESRQKAYGGLDEQLRALMEAQQGLRKETGKLASALRIPQVRGRWGEVQLRRVVELAGMAEHVDFETQVTVEGAQGRQRPDMIVHPPAGRQIVVDAKVPLDAYLSAVEAETEPARQQFLAAHAAHVRAHVRALAEKAYWDQFEQAPDFVVMFIPGESFFAAALEADADLFEWAMDKRVMLASPMTLLTLLRVVAYGWRQERMAENAQKISDAGRELHDRIRVMIEHLSRMGQKLKDTNAAYNDAVGSLEHRVLPSARRIKDLGATNAPDIPTLDQLDTTPRALTAGDGSTPDKSAKDFGEDTKPTD